MLTSPKDTILRPRQLTIIGETMKQSYMPSSLTRKKIISILHIINPAEMLCNQIYF